MAASREALDVFAQRDGHGWGVDAEELRRFFLEYEATIGFSSTFSAMLAAHEGVAMGSGPPANWDPYARIVHKLTEAKRVYHRLQRMDAAGCRRELVTLWRIYGPRNARSVRAIDFGKDHLADTAALLAPYTEAAEEARTELVYRVSNERAEHTGETVARTRRETIDDLERMFWREVRHIAKLEAEFIRLESSKAETAPARADRVHARIEAGWALLGQIVEAVRYDGTIRARIGAIESTDREITVEDAIRSKLDQPRTKTRESLAAWKETKGRFVTAVRIEAYHMRRAAHEAYRAAKRSES